MTLIPVFFFWLIGAAMHHTQGHYDYTAGRFTIFYFLTVAVMIWRPTGSAFSLKNREKLWNLSLAVCAALACYTVVRRPMMIYAVPLTPWTGVFQTLTWIALAASLLLPVLVLTGLQKRAQRTGFCVLALVGIVCLIFAQILVPVLSPKPWIDVWVNNTDAVDYFLKGLNPYAQVYTDIYHGAYDAKPGFVYFPGLLYWLAPFRWLFGDIRYGFVFANLLIAFGAVGLARRLRVSWPTSLLFALLWLSFPVIFFMLEQAWIDTLLGAMAALTLLAVAHKRWILSGFFMGLAFAIKQYGCVIAFIALIQIWREVHWRPALKAAVSAAVTFAVIVLPFVFADFGHFYASTVGEHLSPAPRMDAFNATIYLAREYGWLIPGAGRMTIAMLGILGGGWIVFRKKSPDLADAATGIFVAFGVPFLFGKWAFCNYYDLLASILLLYLVVRSRDQMTQAAES